MHFIILAPGVFLKKLSAIPIDSQSIGNKEYKIYPIEIYVGGQIGNIGI